MATEKQIAANRLNAKKAGRKPGTKNASTLEREAVLKELRNKVMTAADQLFVAQLTLASGYSVLYKIEKYWMGSGKNRKLMKKKPQRVKALWEVEAYLNGLLDEGEMHEPEDTYYFIVMKDPNSAAIDSLLDRTFGRSTQAVEVSNPDGSLKTVIINRPDVKKR